MELLSIYNWGTTFWEYPRNIHGISLRGLLVNQQSYVKSPCLMGKSAISMAIFNSYVKLPEGRWVDLPVMRPDIHGLQYPVDHQLRLQIYSE